MKNFSALEDRKLHVNGLMSVSLRTADAFPVVASLPPKTGEKVAHDAGVFFQRAICSRKRHVTISTLPNLPLS